jgi:Rrf2 family protein
MQISRRTDYGIRVILHLARLPANQRASTHDIAARQHIPGPFLAKIVSQLSVAGLVTTYRGAGGGVALAIPSDQISLLQVIEALDGPLRLNRCLIQPDSCPSSEQCPVHDVLTLAQEQLATLLDVTTFDGLASSALELSS